MILPNTRVALRELADSDFFASDPRHQMARLIAVLAIHQPEGAYNACAACGEGLPCPTRQILLNGGPA
ncbi:MAG: hypothetical protein ABWX96_17610 [Propionibacteriaceae bacterium]